MQVAAGREPQIDPVAAKKAAEEAEEKRLAEIRSLGTPVTPEHFTTWKKRFYAEMALARSRCHMDSTQSGSASAILSDCVLQAEANTSNVIAIQLISYQYASHGLLVEENCGHS